MHSHMIVPAGGLSYDQVEWVASGKKFFLPVKALSKLFRDILCHIVCKYFIQQYIVANYKNSTDKNQQFNIHTIFA